MVFSSVPVYLDPPNWSQQPNHQLVGAPGENPQLPSVLMPPPPPVGAAGGPTSVRPGSMAERARLAKVPQPETTLKCPRCESTNTKFCYFNNYSLTQPRHFCKTCRRYWTRGGALRNVPVGGGCRRNKRSKGSRSKSPNITSDQHQSTSSTSNSAISSNNASCSNDMLNSLPPTPQLPFFPPLHNLTNFGINADIGLNFSGIQTPVMGAGPLNLSARFADQWRLQQVQQFPFLTTGLDQSSAGVYDQFEGDSIDQPLGYGGGATDQLASKTLEAGVSVKLEENQQGANMSRNFMSIPGGSDQYWNGNAWTDLSGSTSSASHFM